MAACPIEKCLGGANSLGGSGLKRFLIVIMPGIALAAVRQLKRTRQIMTFWLGFVPLRHEDDVAIVAIVEDWLNRGAASFKSLFTNACRVKTFAYHRKLAATLSCCISTGK